MKNIIKKSCKKQIYKQNALKVVVSIDKHNVITTLIVFFLNKILNNISTIIIYNNFIPN